MSKNVDELAQAWQRESARGAGMNLIPITDDEYRRLCLRAFENLPSNTAVTMDDVDAILTWCLPEYDQLRGRESTANCENRLTETER